MESEEAIRIISMLYPPDSQYDDTAAIGKELLSQAKTNLNYQDNWKDLPEFVLVEFARLCEEKEARVCLLSKNIMNAINHNF